MIRKTALAALGALLLSVAPAAAAPVPAISDGFTVSGPAGSQTRVRVTRDLPMPFIPGYDGRAVSVSASGGAVAGFVFHGTRAMSYTVGTTPQWTCGAAACHDARLQWGMTYGSNGRDVLPKGDYVLVLVGEPGTRVDVTMPPLARNGRTVRVPASPGAAPEVTPTEDVSTGKGLDAVAWGSWSRTGASRGRALVGVVHAVTAYSSVDSSLGAGASEWCGTSLSAGRSYDGEYPLEPSYRTTSLVRGVAPGDTACASWHGEISEARGTQRGVAFYVPLVR